MADKEEIAQNNRIINAEKYKRRIKKGRIYIDVRDKKLNCLLSKVYSSQEAINRMTKAIYTFEIIACSHDECGNKQCENCETWKWCENIAEAALNALLENKK